MTPSAPATPIARFATSRRALVAIWAAPLIFFRPARRPPRAQAAAPESLESPNFQLPPTQNSQQLVQAIEASLSATQANQLGYLQKVTAQQAQQVRARSRSALAPKPRPGRVGTRTRSVRGLPNRSHSPLSLARAPLRLRCRTRSKTTWWTRSCKP